MKSIMAAILIVMLLIGLVGCAQAARGGNSTTAVPAATGQATQGALPVVVELAAGTIELEDGDLAVDREQAAELLPLWKAYLALSGSDSAVQAELEALVAQIQETMSPEQQRAIADMMLTAERVAAVMGELGVTTTAGSEASASAGAASGRQGGFAGGGSPGGFGEGAPPGGFPGGGPDMMPGGPAASTTTGIQQASTMRAAAFSPLFEAVVKLLESRVGAAK